MKFPGIVEYESGKDYKYYIKKAGGFSSNAKKYKVRLVRNNLMVMLNPNDEKPIKPGDIIMVPEMINAQFFRNFTTIVTIISSSTSILATFVVLTRN